MVDLNDTEAIHCQEDASQYQAKRNRNRAGADFHLRVSLSNSSLGSTQGGTHAVFGEYRQVTGELRNGPADAIGSERTPVHFRRQ